MTVLVDRKTDLCTSNPIDILPRLGLDEHESSVDGSGHSEDKSPSPDDTNGVGIGKLTAHEGRRRSTADHDGDVSPFFRWRCVATRRELGELGFVEGPVESAVVTGVTVAVNDADVGGRTAVGTSGDEP